MDGSSVNGNGPPTEGQKLVESFWRREAQAIQNMNYNDFRNPELPLARIKKIMKLDEDVKMISGEAPVLFAKAVEIFIAELSLRAWVNTEDNKRRTLQRNDIAMGISKYDQFDFLIDIVPREEAKPMNQVRKPDGVASANVLSQDQLNYFLQIAQQQQLPGGSGQPIQIIQASSIPPGQPFMSTPPVMSTPQVVQLNATAAAAHSTDGSQSTNGNEAKGTALATAPGTAGTPILLSNVYGSNGEVVQQMPITLTAQQYQALLQNQGASQGGQPILAIANPQSLSTVPAQFITNSGQMVQAIIPAPAGSMEQHGKVQTSTATEDGES